LLCNPPATTPENFIDSDGSPIRVAVFDAAADGITYCRHHNSLTISSPAGPRTVECSETLLMTDAKKPGSTNCQIPLVIRSRWPCVHIRKGFAWTRFGTRNPEPSEFCGLGYYGWLGSTLRYANRRGFPLGLLLWPSGSRVTNTASICASVLGSSIFNTQRFLDALSS
jgi:hypothetical protein